MCFVSKFESSWEKTRAARKIPAGAERTKMVLLWGDSVCHWPTALLILKTRAEWNLPELKNYLAEQRYLLTLLLKIKRQCRYVLFFPSERYRWLPWGTVMSFRGSFLYTVLAEIEMFFFCTSNSECDKVRTCLKRLFAILTTFVKHDVHVT